jgi:hypothetical protein
MKIKMQSRKSQDKIAIRVENEGRNAIAPPFYCDEYI